ncbi:MAG: 6,7-dimethyl-8-ribityllumazine synthase [Bacteroidales bacterium]|nr:6,7-dimethyl-8-ribityllumazine synthase [Bacteroidales bacterium]
MGTRNLSAYHEGSIPDAGEMRFGIVVADWNPEVTSALLNGALRTLRKHGTRKENIIVRHVPGSFELTLGAQLLAEYEDPDAVICLGCIIQGETPHFTYICQGVTYGITQLNLDYNIPFIFGVLTTHTIQQALNRAGGKHGNKGDEAAVTAIKMAALQKSMEE